eukprot:COSAG02_NODE_2137_length_9694_cov_51.871287_5_plen_155_part_00
MKTGIENFQSGFPTCLESVKITMGRQNVDCNQFSAWTSRWNRTNRNAPEGDSLSDRIGWVRLRTDPLTRTLNSLAAAAAAAAAAAGGGGGGGGAAGAGAGAGAGRWCEVGGGGGCAARVVCVAVLCCARGVGRGKRAAELPTLVYSTGHTLLRT